MHDIDGYSEIHFLWEFFDGVRISFGTWTNHLELVDTSNLIDDEEIRKLTKKFVVKHSYLYDSKECSAVKIDVDWTSLYLRITKGGIQVYDVSPHRCEFTYLPDQSGCHMTRVLKSTWDVLDLCS